MKLLHPILNRTVIPLIEKNWEVLGVNKFDQQNAFCNTPKKTWIGTSVCGPSVVITKYVLQHLNLIDTNQIRVYMNQQGYGDYFEDHSFIVLNQSSPEEGMDEIIVDPTYKQLICNKIDPSILHKLPPIFIGTYDQLESQFTEFKENDDVIRRLKKKYDITEKVDLFIREHTFFH